MPVSETMALVRGIPRTNEAATHPQVLIVSILLIKMIAFVESVNFLVFGKGYT